MVKAKIIGSQRLDYRYQTDVTWIPDPMFGFHRNLIERTPSSPKKTTIFGSAAYINDVAFEIAMFL